MKLTDAQWNEVQKAKRHVFAGGSYEIVAEDDRFTTVKLTQMDVNWGKLVGYIQLSKADGQQVNEVWNVPACDAMCEARVMLFYEPEEQEQDFAAAEEEILAGRSDW